MDGEVAYTFTLSWAIATSGRGFQKGPVAAQRMI